MATATQIPANIASPQHPTANSAKPGLNGASAVLSHENQSEFNLILEHLIEEFQAETEHERFLVEQMAQARWRISRIDRIETAAFDQMTKGGDPQLDPDGRIAAHMLTNGAAILSSLQRYRTAAQNSYAKCYKLLCDSRAVRVARRTAANIDASIARIINAPMPAAPSTFSGPRMPLSQNPNLRL